MSQIIKSKSITFVIHVTFVWKKSETEPVIDAEADIEAVAETEAEAEADAEERKPEDTETENSTFSGK